MSAVFLAGVAVCGGLPDIFTWIWQTCFCFLTQKSWRLCPIPSVSSVQTLPLPPSQKLLWWQILHIKLGIRDVSSDGVDTCVCVYICICIYVHLPAELIGEQLGRVRVVDRKCGNRKLGKQKHKINRTSFWCRKLSFYLHVSLTLLYSSGPLLYQGKKINLI